MRRPVDPLQELNLIQYVPKIISPFQYSGGGGGGSIALITSVTLGSLRNNFGDRVGFKATVGASPITITDIGRWIVSGNSQTHLLEIYNAAGDTQLASATIDTTLFPSGDFGYVALASPLVISAGAAFIVTSIENNGGDQWYSDDSTITTTGDATVNYSRYSIVNDNTPGTTYGPLNVKYTL